MPTSTTTQEAPLKSAEQLTLEIGEATRTMPLEKLVEHIILLYATELEKANECIAALNASLKASGLLVQAKEQANDELFRIKQRVVIANRELRQTNNDLTHVLRRFVDELPTKRDWLDPDLEKAARAVLKGQRALPVVTDELRDACARLTCEATDDSGFAKDIILLLNFLEEYDYKTDTKHAQPVRADGHGDANNQT